MCVNLIAYIQYFTICYHLIFLNMILKGKLIYSNSMYSIYFIISEPAEFATINKSIDRSIIHEKKLCQRLISKVHQCSVSFSIKKCSCRKEKSFCKFPFKSSVLICQWDVTVRSKWTMLCSKTFSSFTSHAMSRAHFRHGGTPTVGTSA